MSGEEAWTSPSRSPGWGRSRSESRLTHRCSTALEHATTTVSFVSSTNFQRGYVKAFTYDDDYRLSFLYGNFTTLTRFTENDLERVIVENLSPIWVSIHATDPEVRSRCCATAGGQ